jgi:asparagine synthetase B (glutamine-hydrolysing)
VKELHNLSSIGLTILSVFIMAKFIYYHEFEENTYSSDGQCLIPLYKRYGNKFPKYLDGEFAIVLFDFRNNIFFTFHRLI